LLSCSSLLLSRQVAWIICSAVELTRGNETVQRAVWCKVQISHEHAWHVASIQLAHSMDSVQNDPDLRHLSRQRFEYLEGGQAVDLDKYRCWQHLDLSSSGIEKNVSVGNHKQLIPMICTSASCQYQPASQYSGKYDLAQLSKLMQAEVFPTIT